MRPLLLLSFLLLTTLGLLGQTPISGVVRDQKGKPITGASIAIRDSYDGATTDSAGRFSFRTTEKGNQVVTVSAIGYKAAEEPVVLEGNPITLNLVIREEVSEMKAVVITAGSFEASDKKRTTVLNSIDIVTTASANADVTGAIRTLPGAQQVGESEGLFVRGGTAAETKTFIDGTLVNNFFYSSVPDIAQRGRFSPFLFKGTVFSAGGYSALYGQALSSALILESIDLPERSSGSLAVSPIGGGGGYQHLAKDKRSSWGASYNYTDVGLAFKVLPQRPQLEYVKIPRFHTGEGNFRIKTSNTGMLKYYGYFSQNSLGIRNPSIDTAGYKERFGLTNFNIYHNLSWKNNLGDRWKFNGGVSYANNRDEISGRLQSAANEDVLLNGFEYKNFDLEARGRYFNAKAVFERRLRGLSAIRVGSEFNHSFDSSKFRLYNGQTAGGIIRENLVSLFAETDVYLTNDLAAKLGGRMERSALLDKINLAPRLSLAYKLGRETQASLAYGIFYQTPERRYLPSINELSFTKATHYIAQVQKVTALQTLRAELYYKKYDDLLKTTISSNREVAQSNSGTGYAQGFELFWRDKKTIKNFDYWISYSYLDTKRDFLNYPGQLRPSFAAKHTANLVLKKFVTGLKTQFNANYTWASGRPYYNIRYNSTESKYQVFDQGQTIPFNSLSFSVNYLPNVFKQGAGKFTVFVFSITNVLGSRQVFGYNYSYNGYRKEAVTPANKTFIYLGAFFSFGVDRTQDVINNNL